MSHSKKIYTRTAKDKSSKEKRKCALKTQTKMSKIGNIHLCILLENQIKMIEYDTFKN